MNWLELKGPLKLAQGLGIERSDRACALLLGGPGFDPQCIIMITVMIMMIIINEASSAVPSLGAQTLVLRGGVHLTLVWFVNLYSFMH